MAAKERVSSRLTLSDFHRYLDDKRRELEACYKDVEEVQFQFNDIFKQELAAWQKQFSFCFPRIIAERQTLPPDFGQLLDRAEQEERARIQKEIAGLDKEIAEGQAQMDALMAQGQAETEALRQTNPELNQQEEQLKALMVKYQDEYADAYEEMEKLESSSLGWLTHAGRIARLKRVQRMAKEQQEKTLDKLRTVRQEWANALREAGDRQAQLREEWQKTSIKVSEAKTRRSHLQDNLDTLAEQAAAQRVLQELIEAPAIEGELGTALQDLVRRNQVRRDYEKGLRTVAEILGLTKGVGEGMNRFQRSVRTVLQEQRRYNLKEVRVPISEFVATMNDTWKELQAKVRDEKYMGKNPLEFSQVVDAYVKKRLTDNNIQRLFEDMGEALNQATRAWK